MPLGLLGSAPAPRDLDRLALDRDFASTTSQRGQLGGLARVKVDKCDLGRGDEDDGLKRGFREGGGGKEEGADLGVGDGGGKGSEEEGGLIGSAVRAQQADKTHDIRVEGRSKSALCRMRSKHLLGDGVVHAVI